MIMFLLRNVVKVTICSFAVFSYVLFIYALNESFLYVFFLLFVCLENFFAHFICRYGLLIILYF